MVAFSVSSSVSLTPNSLKEILQQLDRQELPPIPKDLQSVIDIHEVSYSFTVIEVDYPGSIIARTLSEVWYHELKRHLEQIDAATIDWIRALTPIALYITPLTEDSYLERSLPKADKEPFEIALERLQDEQWLKTWVQDPDRIEVIKPGAYASKPTFYRWLDAGIAYFYDAIKDSLEPSDNIIPNFYEGFVPPNCEVERTAELNQLRELALKASQEGKWIALIGLGGIGKTTLLGTFLQKRGWEVNFPGGVVPLSGYPISSQEKSIALLQNITNHLLRRRFPEDTPVETLRHTLKEHLANHNALAVIDNIEDPRAFKLLKKIPGLIVVLATRTIRLAESLGVEPEWQIHIAGLTHAEARELAETTSGLTPISDTDEDHALNAVLNLVDYYPIAIEIAAKLAKKQGWVNTRQDLSDIKSRKLKLGYGAAVSNAWITLETVWEKLTSDLQVRLAQLGAAPFFASYDGEAGRAIWQTNKTEAKATWDSFQEYCLVQEIRGNRYRIHTLVWELAEHKTDTIDPGKIQAVRGWEKRYKIQRTWEDWRWWHPSIPKPDVDEYKWSILSPHVPKTPAKLQLRWLLAIVKDQFWQAEDGINLSVTPIEWVIMHRRSRLIRPLVILTAILGALNIPLIIMAIFMQPLFFTIILLICSLLTGFLAILTFWLVIDQRRIMMWRISGKSFTSEPQSIILSK